MLPYLSSEPVMDLVLMVDVSEQPGKDLAQLKRYLKGIVNGFQFGTEGTKVSIVTFSRFAQTRTYFDSYYTKDGLFDEINEMQLSGTDSHYFLALWLLNTEVFLARHGAREDSSKVALFISDYRPSDLHIKVWHRIHERTLGNIRSRGIHIYSVGIGDRAGQDLLQSLGDTPDHYHFMESYSDLDDVRQIDFASRCLRDIGKKLELLNKV